MSKDKNHRSSMMQNATPAHKPTPSAINLLQMAAVQAVLRMTSHSEEVVLKVAERMLYDFDPEGDLEDPSSGRAKSNGGGEKTRSHQGVSNKRDNTGASVAPSKELSAVALLKEIEDRYGLGPADNFVGHRGEHPEASYLRHESDVLTTTPQPFASPFPNERRRGQENNQGVTNSSSFLSSALPQPSSGGSSRSVENAQDLSRRENSLQQPQPITRSVEAVTPTSAPTNSDIRISSAPPPVELTQSYNLPPPASPESRQVREKINALREENSRLRARQQCHRCKVRPANLTFLPCGHFCFCVECGRSFHQCPVCQKTILADVQTFVA